MTPTRMKCALLLMFVLGACGGAPPRGDVPVAPAPGAAAPASAPVDEAQANAAYEAQDWPRCAALFEALALDEATPPPVRMGAAYNAACCHARAGAAEPAFALLEQVAADGLHAVDHVAADPDLASLHDDARWSPLLDRLRANLVAYEASFGAPALRRELLAMEVEDQAARSAWIAQMDDPALRDAVMAIDARTTARMREIVAEHGWPGRKLVGDDGAAAAWLLVQHADQHRDFQKQCLALLEAAVAAGDAEPRHLAYLHDRVAVAEQRPQRYGTQFGEDGEPAPIEDEANVDARRAAVGLGTMAEYREEMRRVYGR
jgi:hypothetical protein